MGLGRLHGHDHSSADTPGRVLGHPRAYDLCVALWFGGRRGRVYSRLATLSGARPGDRALDVGCGTGYLSRRLAAVVGPEGAVLGVDPSGSLLERARRLAPRNCSYTLGVAESLDAADGSFDAVATCLMIHHLPAELRGRAVAEMYRVLRPGGRILLADFRPPTNRLARRLVGALTDPAMQHNPVHQLPDLVQQAGFQQLDTGDLHPWISYVRGSKPDSPGSPG
jgi:ubiquinone/menaquinone biosynthesis C-methylase UbiE